MFKKIFLTLALIILGQQCDLKANNVLNNDILQISPENFGEQELVVLEKIIEQSPEVQALLQDKDEATGADTLIHLLTERSFNCDFICAVMLPIVTITFLIGVGVGALFITVSESQREETEDV